MIARPIASRHAVSSARVHRKTALLLRLLPIAALLALAGAASASAAVRPQRIVSLNLCADQYLLALADPGQIAALSPYARDPALSYYAARAATVAIASSSGEEVLMRRPDLVIGAPSRLAGALAPLRARGVPVIDLPFDNGLAEIERSIRLVAAAIGHPERGRAMIAALHRRLAAAGTPAGRGRTIAEYQRRGYVSGSGTMVDEIERRVGLVNLATRLGRPALSQMALEELVLARPDFLLVERDAGRPADEGAALLRHPLLDRVIPPARRLSLPGRFTVCGGFGYADAVASLAAQLRAADRSAGAGVTAPPPPPPARAAPRPGVRASSRDIRRAAG